MYRESVEHLKPGHVVAQDVRDDIGRVLLRPGTVLSHDYITGLKRHGIVAIRVRDGFADDVPVRDIVSVPLRRSAASHLSTVFDGAVLAARVDPTDDPADVTEAIRRLGDQPLRMGDSARAAIEALYADIEQLISESVDNYTEAGLTSLKTYSDYTFQHSVDVAAVGAILGSKAGLNRHELRELAAGCLLHDLGKIYIDIAILDKPGELTPEEYDQIKRHPELGFEIVRRMPMGSILPAHVAYQHHERQDGNGYPRGLRGSNRIVRTSAERFDGRRMLLIAEIAAVADVYSALTADRPYREALRHDVAADIVAGMAGQHLNRDIVGLFERVFPRYPIGHWVEVTAGRHQGHLGVVVAVAPARPSDPVVRLLLDAHGRELAEPSEVDLRATADMKIALCAPPMSALADGARAAALGMSR